MGVEYPCILIGVDLSLPCIEWTGYRTDKGYGQRRYNGVVMLAHRAAYITAKGDPGDLYVDHLCRNPGCVNPWHLEAVTNADNVLRGIGPTAVNKRKTHCKRGHEFTPENTIKNGNGRKCKTCHRATTRAGNQRTRASLSESIQA